MSQINGRVILGENISATGSGLIWRGGAGMFMVHATAFNAGTVKMQMLLTDGGGNQTWIDVKNITGTNISLTSDGAIPFDVPPCELCVNITSATGVYAYAVGSFTS